MKLTGAVGYFDVGSVQGEVTTTSATPACTANPAFFGGPQGNTTGREPLGCPTLVNDFNMIEAVAQAEFTIADQPLQIFAQYIQNEEADDLDTGWLAGFNWGKASNPRSWEFGYAYGLIEKDATVRPVRGLRLRRRRDRRRTAASSRSASRPPRTGS